jgi:nucleoside-diphosphate kinase
MPLQESFFMIKPDGMEYQREIQEAFHSRGLWIARYVIRRIMAEEIVQQYEEVANMPFFPYTIKYLTSSPVALGIVMGDDAIDSLHTLAGATRPWQAEPGTIRHRFGSTRSQEEADLEKGNIRNIVHTSDSDKAVKCEAGIYLPDHKITTL